MGDLLPPSARMNGALHDTSSEDVIQQNGMDGFQGRTPEEIQFNWEHQHPAIPQESLELLINKPRVSDTILEPGGLADKIAPKLAAMLGKSGDATPANNKNSANTFLDSKKTEENNSGKKMSDNINNNQNDDDNYKKH